MLNKKKQHWHSPRSRAVGLTELTAGLGARHCHFCQPYLKMWTNQSSPFSFATRPHHFKVLCFARKVAFLSLTPLPFVFARSTTQLLLLTVKQSVKRLQTDHKLSNWHFLCYCTGRKLTLNNIFTMKKRQNYNTKWNWFVSSEMFTFSKNKSKGKDIAEQNETNHQSILLYLYQNTRKFIRNSI